jgi:hypothetical protein
LLNPTTHYCDYNNPALALTQIQMDPIYLLRSVLMLLSQYFFKLILNRSKCIERNIRLKAKHILIWSYVELESLLEEWDQYYRPEVGGGTYLLIR